MTGEINRALPPVESITLTVTPQEFRALFRAHARTDHGSIIAAGCGRPRLRDWTAQQDSQINVDMYKIGVEAGVLAR